MTDRANAFIVVLDEDYRIGDFAILDSIERDGEVAVAIGADAIAHAIRMIKGVASVEPNVANPSDIIAQLRISTEVRKKLLDFLKEL